jgi:hypothetical protein
MAGGWLFGGLAMVLIFGLGKFLIAVEEDVRVRISKQ